MNQPNFDAAKLSAFVQTQGWIQVTEAIRDGLYVFNHPDFAPLQLIFAMKDFRDSDETLLRAANRLAQIYEVTTLETIRKIEESGDDVVVSRVPNENNHRTATVSLLYAAQVMEAQKKLLLAGAVANKERRPFYSSNVTGDAKKLMEAARFRHTEQGSFVFKTSCGVYAVGSDSPLDKLSLFSSEEIAPSLTFVRRAMLNIGIGLQELVDSITTRRIDQLVENVKAQQDSSVSANLCAAIGELRDEEHPHSVDLSVSWSPLLPPPPEAPRQPIRIVADYFPQIEEIRQELQPAKKPRRDVYIATADRLEGTFNDFGQREGRVLLTLLTGVEGTIDKPTQVRVVLDSAKYDQAVEIQKTNKVMAKVEGTILSGQRQPFGFDLAFFEIINL